MVDLTRNLTQYVADAFNNAKVSKPADVVLTGPSQGGLITTLAVEQYPNAAGVARDRKVFSGGLAACGPYGSFQKQVDYLGHTLVVFNYYFPEVFNGSVTPLNVELNQAWEAYADAIRTAVAADPIKANYLRNAVGLPTRDNSTAAADIAESLIGALWYVVHATNDANTKLGGNPFGNSDYKYSTGNSDEDARLNGGVGRYTASETAKSNIANYYETSGGLRVPFTTVHTSLDPVVPVWHQEEYTRKSGGLRTQHKGYTHTSYGHCNFDDDAGQKLLKDAFSDLIYRIKGVRIIFQ